MTKEEKKEYMREYRLNNKERIKKVNKEYKHINRDKIKEYECKYRANNSDRLKVLRKKRGTKYNNKQAQYSANKTKELHDYYIKDLLKSAGLNINNELIEQKRLQVRIKRLIKQKENEARKVNAL